MNFRIGAVSRSFAHKRDALGPKFPDSERGETRQRASFLIDNSKGGGDRNHFNRMSLSPTLGEKTFTKTPRMTLESDPNASSSHTDESPNGKEGAEKAPGKKSSIFSHVLFSKHRNRR